jgi:hypothetical protein
MNKMKRYKILPKQKFFVIKNFCNLPPKFVRGLNKSWLEFHLFCMNEIERNEVEGSFMVKKTPILLIRTYLMKFLLTV